MAKVTITEAPVATHDPKKSKTATLQDSLGRTIVVRDLDPMQKARLVMAVGGEVAANSVFMSGFAIPCAMVTHVDDDFFGMPQNVKQIETMLGILKEEGLDCVTNFLIERHEAQAEAQRKAADSAEQAAAKN